VNGRQRKKKKERLGQNEQLCALRDKFVCVSLSIPLFLLCRAFCEDAPNWQLLDSGTRSVRVRWRGAPSNTAS